MFTNFRYVNVITCTISVSIFIFRYLVTVHDIGALKLLLARLRRHGFELISGFTDLCLKALLIFELN